MHHRPSRAAVIAGAVAVTLAPRAVRAQTATLRVASDPFDAYAEALYAQDLGLYKKAGLDVDLQLFANGAAITTALAGGAADVGISNPIALATAVLHGVPFTMIAGGGMYSSKSPTTLLCVAATSPIKTAKDLDGKTIAVGSLQDITVLAARAWFVQNGLAATSAHFVEMPYTAMGPAVQRGTVDAVVLLEPAMSAAEGRGEIRVLARVYDAIAPEFLIGAYFSTADFVGKNPVQVRAFTSAIYAAGKWANANQTASADILGKYAKMPPETTHRMRRVLYADRLTPNLVQPELDIAYKNGLLDKAVSAADLIARI